MIATISIIIKICLQKIWEKENFQDNEHDKKLDQDDQPNLFPPAGHFTKTFGIKMINSPENIHG